MQELVDMGFISREQFEKAKSYQRKKGCLIGIALMELNFVTPQIMEKFAEKVLNVL